MISITHISMRLTWDVPKNPSQKKYINIKKKSMTERRHFEHVQMSMCSQLKLNYVSKLFLMYLNSCFLLLLQDKS